MPSFATFCRQAAAAVIAGIVLAACSSVDRSVDPTTGLKAAGGPNASLGFNGNITICKMTGPPGVYHFHVDVTGGGTFTLPAGPDNTVVFDGSSPSCWQGAYTTTNDATWFANPTASVTVTETLIPAGAGVDSLQLNDGFGNIETTVVTGNAITITETSLGVHTVKVFNGAVPIVGCVAINAIANQAITPVTVLASGGSGGPYTFSATGLPNGLTMASDGTISGTPTVTGTFTYTVTATDSKGHKGTSNCSVTVNAAPTADCVSLNAVQGTAMTPVTLVGSGGTGGPYTFSATGLPTGITISTGGTISGTPLVNGTYNYAITVTDKDGNKGTVNCSTTVSNAPSAGCVTIVAVQNVAITPVTMIGSGGTGGPYTFSATGLPNGLVMSTGGTISGTPTVTGTFNYTVTVTDAGGNKGSVNCSVTVLPPPTANCVAIVAVQNVAITPVTMIGSGGTGGPYTFSATGLPNGLTMSANGTISGTPTVSGTFSYTVTVTDKNGHTGTINCSVTVSPPPKQLGNQGCTPGYWKQSQHFDSWVGTGYTTSQLLGTVFTIPSSYAIGGTPLANFTMLDALAGGGGASLSAKAEIMLRAAVAGLLNAGKSNVLYAWTTTQIVTSVNAALAGGDATTITNLGTQTRRLEQWAGWLPAQLVADGFVKRVERRRRETAPYESVCGVAQSRRTGAGTSLGNDLKLGRDILVMISASLSHALKSDPATLASWRQARRVTVKGVQPKAGLAGVSAAEVALETSPGGVSAAAAALETSRSGVSPSGVGVLSTRSGVRAVGDALIAGDVGAPGNPSSVDRVPGNVEAVHGSESKAA